MGQVRTTFTSEDKDVQSALDRMTRQMQRYADENRKLTAESRQTRDAQKSVFAEAERGATLAIAKFQGLSQAVAAYNSMLEQTRRLQERAANSVRTVAGSQGEFINNLGNVSLQEMQRSVAGVEAVSKRTGIALDVLYDTAGIASASKGNLSLQQSLAHVEQATRITREPQQLPEVAMGLLNVSNFLGTSDPKTAAGFLMAMSEQSPVPKMSQIAANLVPAAKSVAARGGTAAEAAALVNTIASSMQDAQGAMSGTSAISLAEQLAQRVPGQGDTLSRLRFLQQNPGAAQSFIQKSSFEKKAQATIEALLDPNSKQSALLQENLAKFPGIDGLAAAFDEFGGKKTTFGPQQFAASEGSMQQAMERLRRGNQEGANIGMVRQFVSDALDESGAWDFPVIGRKGWLMRGFDQLTEGPVFGMGKRLTPEEAAIRTLEERKSQFGVGAGEDSKLDQMIAELRGIRANQRTTNPEAHRE